MQNEAQGAPGPAAPAHVLACGSGGNRVTISITGDFMRIDVAGEALDEGIVGCFRDAIAQGFIRPNMVVLVDLSSFNGGVYWGTIHAIAALAPWGSEVGRPSKVAYVSKSAWFSAMVKLTSVLFPKSQHRQFSGLHNAIQWLEGKN